MRSKRAFSRIKFKKLIFVSGWDFDDGLAPEHKLFWPNKIDHDKIKVNVKEFVVIHSSNDPWVSIENNELFKQMLDAETLVIPDMKHFSGDDGIRELPVALESVLKISN